MFVIFQIFLTNLPVLSEIKVFDFCRQGDVLRHRLVQGSVEQNQRPDGIPMLQLHIKSYYRDGIGDTVEARVRWHHCDLIGRFFESPWPKLFFY